MQINISEQEVLEGLVLAHKEQLSLEENIVLSNELVSAERVTVVVMGAGGHEPSVAGFVGQGMADAAVIGNLEAAPGPARVLKAIGLADRGQGVLLVVLNNAGDVLTSNIVLKQAEKLGLKVARVIVKDEALEKVSAEAEELVNRELCQGLVGVLPVLKLAGAAAQAGLALEEVAKVVQACADNTATATLKVEAVKEDITPEEVVELLLPSLEANLKLQQADQLLVIVNGNGSASLREQLAVYRSCFVYLVNKGYNIAASAVDSYFTGQAETYLQITCTKLSEQQLKLWQAK